MEWRRRSTRGEGGGEGRDDVVATRAGRNVDFVIQSFVDLVVCSYT